MSYRTFETNESATEFCVQVREEGGTVFSTGRTETGKVGVYYAY